MEAPLADGLLPANWARPRTAWRRTRGPNWPSGGADPARAVCVRRAHLRYEGTDTALPVPLGGTAEMTAAFERAYRQQFSFLMPDKTIVVEAVSVEVDRRFRGGPRGCHRLRGRRLAGQRAF